MKLLKKMCEIHSPAGEELAMQEFLLSYISRKIKTVGKYNLHFIMVMVFKII